MEEPEEGDAVTLFGHIEGVVSYKVSLTIGTYYTIQAGKGYYMNVPGVFVQRLRLEPERASAEVEPKFSEH